MTPVSRGRGAGVATTAVLGALLAASALPATADSGASTSPSDATSSPAPAASADPALTGRAATALAADLERLEAARITPAMTEDATFVLDVADPTFVLDPADATARLETTAEQEGDTVVTLTSDLLFDFGEATLTPQAESAVAELAADIGPDATVQVDGYTDSVGGDRLNQRLSTRRAQAVADVLGAARADLTLEVAGHGEADPVAENTVAGADNPAGRALNRRVEVTYATS